MSSAKDRITPRKVKAAKAANKPPVVAPPAVHVAAPVVHVDHSDFISVMKQMNKNYLDTMNSMQHMMADHQKAWMKMAEANQALMKTLDAKTRNINVSSPPRPSDFSVEFDDENGDLTTMRIHANVQH